MEDSLVRLLPLGMALLSISCAVMGWFGRALWTAVQDLKADLQILEVKLATDYVRYDRLERMMEPFKDSLKRIEDVLVHKVDKP